MGERMAELGRRCARLLLGAELPKPADPGSLLKYPRLPTVGGPHEETTDLILAEARRTWEAEQSRAARIESKAAAMLVGVSVSVSLASGLLLAALKGEPLRGDGAAMNPTLLAFALLGVGCFVAAAACALRALRASMYGVPSIADFKEAGSAHDLKRQLANAYLTHAYRNMPRNNEKADWVRLAQTLVLRGVVLLGLAALLACLRSFCSGGNDKVDRRRQEPRLASSVLLSDAGVRAVADDAAESQEPDSEVPHTRFVGLDQDAGAGDAGLVLQPSSLLPTSVLDAAAVDPLP